MSYDTQARDGYDAPSRNSDTQPAADVSRIQIFRFIAKDKILDIGDMLAFDPKRSKIAFTLVEFDENNRATQRVRHYVDSDDFKLVCHDLLSGAFMQFEDQKGSTHDDHTEARQLWLKRETKYRQPFVLRIDNGHGEVYGNGQVKMVKATDSLTVQMPDFEARKMAMVVSDYIREWEMIHFRRRQEARTVTFTPGS